MTEDKQKYVHMENVLQYINKNYISLEDKMKKQYNIYQVVVSQIIAKMKETSELFKVMFREVFYGGSYYDGLKITKPEEYDLDLLFKLPQIAKPTMTASDLPGFVRVQLVDFDKFTQQPEYKAYYKDFVTLLNDNKYLDAKKVKSWMESLIKKTLNKFEQSGDQTVIICDKLDCKDKRFLVKVIKGGPAFTLDICNEEMRVNVDLVPCFVFDEWPKHCGFKCNPIEGNNTFFIVPKTPEQKSKGNNADTRYWRMSFQIQEREIMREKANFKPALKLLKRLRDQQGHAKISSYYLKTVFLYEANRNDEFWSSNLSTVFMTMLKVYMQRLKDNCIPYFWNKNHNMIQHIEKAPLENIMGRINKIVSDIERNITDPFVVVKYLVDEDQFGVVKQAVNNTPNPTKPQNKTVSKV